MRPTHDASPIAKSAAALHQTVSVWAVPVGAASFALPAIMLLANNAWQSEAGSLGPLILAMGAWTLWYRYKRTSATPDPQPMATWFIGMAFIVPAYLLANAIEMAMGAALAAWAGLALTFYVATGPRVTRACLFPLAFLGLLIPLPYSISVELNVVLREWLSVRAVDLASLFGLDVAHGDGIIAVGPYVLAVENACAGASSTISLIALGLMFAHLTSDAGIARSLIVTASAIPIAIAANILRIDALIVLTAFAGTAILDTAIHPLSGIISFVLALAMLIGVVSVLPRSPSRILTRTGERPAA